MRVRIIAQSIAIAPLKLEFGIWIPVVESKLEKGRTVRRKRLELGVEVATDMECHPGQQIKLEFDWPFPKFTPKECVFKASVKCSQLFDLIVFEADDLGPLIKGSGTPCAPGSRLFA